MDAKSTAVVDRKALSDALRTLKPLVNSRSIGTESSVRLGVSKGSLTVEAWSPTATMIINLPAETQGSGRIVVTHKTLLSAFTGSRNRSVSLDLDSKEIVLRFPNASGNGASRTIGSASVTMPWPDEKEPTGRPWILTERMASAIGRVLPASSKDDSRPVLHALNFEKTYVVATDSYRLFWMGPFAPLPPLGLIPRPVLELALKTCAGGFVVADEGDPERKPNRVMFVSADDRTEIIASRRDGIFPEWRTIIKNSTVSDRSKYFLRLNRQELSEAVARSAALGPAVSYGTPVISLKQLTPDLLKIESVGVNDGSNEVIGCKVTFMDRRSNSMPIFGLNPKFLAECLKQLTGDTVTIEVADTLKPLFIHDGDFHIALMPVRLR